MSWMVPESQLDPNQRDFLQRFNQNGNNNYWVKGFAGSGKSVLVVHAVIQAKRDNPKLSACIVLFTHSLIDQFRTGMPDDISDVPVMTYHQFKNHPRAYDLILVDEVQDLPPDVLALLKRNCRRLIVAGDEAQSIYDECVSPEDIPRLTEATPYVLTILHRLTNKIIEIATMIFPDKHLESAKKSRLKNVDVTRAHANVEADEVAYVWQTASAATVPGVPVAILLPKRDLITRFVNEVLRHEGREEWTPSKNQWGKTDFGAMNRHLKDAGLKLRYIGNQDGKLAETEREGIVVLMTYHSAKGLDFETVFLPYLNDGVMIWRDDPGRAKTLFYVAITRSRLNLFLSYTGRPHPFIARIPDRLVHSLSLPVPVPPAALGVGDESEVLF